MLASQSGYCESILHPGLFFCLPQIFSLWKSKVRYELIAESETAVTAFEINPFASPLCMNYSSLSRTSRGSERPKCLPRKNCVGCYISNITWNVRWHLSLVLSRVQERARDSTQVESWGADIVSCFDRIPLRVRGTFSHLDTSMILNFLFFFGPDCGHICQRRAERYQYTHWYSARKPMSPVLMNIYENQFFL